LDYDRRSRAFIALSVMGIAVAFYHAYGELTYTIGGLNSCSFSTILSCTSVFASGLTTFPPAGSIPGFPGISFWVYGVVWFPLCVIVGLWSIRKHGGLNPSVLVPFLMVGNIFTLYPWDIEIVILRGVFCIVCVSMYVINYVLTILAFSSKPIETEEPEEDQNVGLETK
jgi:uncharacterized membrane protein